MTETVLLAPVRDAEVPDKVWAAVGGRRLSDCGDHVEFQDGDRLRSWRLADQPESSLPELAGLAKVLVPNPYQTSYAGTNVDLVFIGPAGQLLALWNTPGSRHRVIAEHAFPAAAMEPFRQRGLAVTEETIKSFREFNRRHPGGDTGLARRLSYAWA